MKRFIYFAIAFFIFSNANSQNTLSLQKNIESFLLEKQALVGIAAIYDGKDTLSINNTYQYPTMSIYKLHQSIAVLDYLEKNKISLNQTIFVKKDDLLPTPIHSPLRDDRPEGNFNISIDELIRYNICLSDNSSCDILFKYIGGLEYVNQYIQKLGIKNTHIGATELEMNTIWNCQYSNWATPKSIVEFIEKVLSGKIVSKSHTDYIKNVMIETPTGKNKIKGLLPSEIIVGHKTGASFRNADGLNVAENDAGFMILPDGKIITIAVLVAHSLEDQTTNCEIIAKISKMIYDHYSKN